MLPWRISALCPALEQGLQSGGSQAHFEMDQQLHPAHFRPCEQGSPDSYPAVSAVPRRAVLPGTPLPAVSLVRGAPDCPEEELQEPVRGAMASRRLPWRATGTCVRASLCGCSRSWQQPRRQCPEHLDEGGSGSRRGPLKRQEQQMPRGMRRAVSQKRSQEPWLHQEVGRFLFRFDYGKQTPESGSLTQRPSL